MNFKYTVRVHKKTTKDVEIEAENLTESIQKLITSGHYPTSVISVLVIGLGDVTGNFKDQLYGNLLYPRFKLNKVVAVREKIKESTSSTLEPMSKEELSSLSQSIQPWESLPEAAVDIIDDLIKARETAILSAKNVISWIFDASRRVDDSALSKSLSDIAMKADEKLDNL